MGKLPESLPLHLPRPFHAFPYLCRRFSGGPGSKVLVPHRRYFNVNVNAVQQRPADFCQIPLNLLSAAGALAGWVGVIPTGTGIHGCRQHKIGRVGEGNTGPGDGDYTVLHGLAQYFQHIFLELRQFI